MIIIRQLKSSYKSPFKDSCSHPIHTYFVMTASNGIGKYHDTNTLQTYLIYLERRKMILLLFSILSAILALIVRPAIQSLSWIISLNPYSFSKSNLLLLFLLFFMKTSDTHFASLWLKKMLQITIISFSRKTDQDHKID